MSAKQKEKGFTIIEVVLVLAIAGLIFMMVFLALPALQRSQRDTQRKNDLSRAITSIANYSSSNRGDIPTSAGVPATNFTNLVNNYLITAGDSFIDPAGAGTAAPAATFYQFTASTVAPSATGTAITAQTYSTALQNVIYYRGSSTCGNGSTLVTAGTRKLSLYMYLEGGGIYCLNN